MVKKSVVEDGSTVQFIGRLRGEGNHKNKNTTSRRDRRSNEVRNLQVVSESECASGVAAHLADEGKPQHVGGGFLNRLILTRALWRRSKTVEQLYNTAGRSRSQASMSSNWVSDNDRFKMWPFCSSGDNQGYTLGTGKSLVLLKQLKDEMRLSHVNIRIVEENWKRHRAAVTEIEKKELGVSAEIEMSGPV